MRRSSSSSTSTRIWKTWRLYSGSRRGKRHSGAKFWVNAALNARLFFMRYGLRNVLITSFAKADEAEQFGTLCTVAATHALAKTLHAFPVVTQDDAT